MNANSYMWAKVVIEYMIVISYAFFETSIIPHLISVSKSLIFIIWGLYLPSVAQFSDYGDEEFIALNSSRFIFYVEMMAIPVFFISFIKFVKEMVKHRKEGRNVVEELRAKGKKKKGKNQQRLLEMEKEPEEESDDRVLEVDSSIYSLTFLAFIKTIFAKYDLSSHADQYLF